MEPEKFNPVSHTLTDDLKSQLKMLVPEAFTEEEIDFDRLKTLLGEMVEVGQERYSFSWPGKTQAVRAAQTPSIGTLVPDKEASEDWDTTGNLYLEGDNLEILKLLQKSYTGKVKMIYIDPPYNTGKDFVYPDNYGEGLKTYLEYTGQVDGEGKKITTNTETDGRYHSKWLNMMYPRLMLARNLLKDDGVIFISIDDHEQANLKKICDEIFGADNFIGQIIVTRSEGGGLAKQMIIGHDYLLVYSKNQEKFKPLRRPKDIRGKVVEKDGEKYWIEEDWLRKEFGKYGTLEYEDIEEIKGIEKKKEIDEGIKNGEYVLIKKQDKQIVGRYRKISEDGSKFYTLIKHLSAQGIEDVSSLDMGQLFDFPKPVSLIKSLTLGASFFTKNDGDIVLDFFSGSATTAHAVMELNAEDGGNRKFVMSQLQEETPEVSEARKAGYQNIAELGRERIKRAGAKIKEESAEKLAEREVPLDTGFRTYRLTSSTFNTWDANSEDDMQAKLLESKSLIKEESRDEDVLTELILKSGYGLSLPIETVEIGDITAHSVEGGELLIVLSGLVSQEAVRAIVDSDPKRFIARESAFSSDADLTNAAQIMKDKGVDFRVL